MRRLGIWLLTGLLGATLVPAADAQSFFGLFGRGEDERVEVINPQPYEVRVVGPEGDIRRQIARASVLWQDREQPASGAAGLIARARGDYSRILSALYGAGHYGATISITIAGREADGLPLSTSYSAAPEVVITVDPGPVYRFGATGFDNPAPRAGFRDQVDDSARRRFVTGEVAEAGIPAEAAAEVIDAWRERGHPLARVAGQDIVANHADRRLDARISIDPGPRAVMGSTTVRGESAVDRAFIAWMAEIPRGVEFDPFILERAEARLSRLGTFRSFRVLEAEALASDGSLPVTIEVEDRLPRRFGVGATLSSIDGLGLEAFWLHRNLLGRAEQLRFAGAIEGIGGTDVTDYDYILGATFTRPGTFTQDLDMTLGFAVKQEVLDLYRERSVAANVGFSRIISETLSASAGLEFKQSEFRFDDGNVDTFTTLSLPVTATYDRRDSQTDATRGFYARAELRPFHEFDDGASGLRTELEIRGYRPLGERFVLAGRARLGSLAVASADETPTDFLFLAGGGGSVRGYEYRSIGVISGGDEMPGRSLAELSGELRAGITESIGLVGFVDAGYVSDDVLPGAGGDFRTGAGIGLRYQTGVGPIRLDVAFPLDRRQGDPAAAFYIGIGQAF